jgi:hypothetical protein
VPVSNADKLNVPFIPSVHDHFYCSSPSAEGAIFVSKINLCRQNIKGLLFLKIFSAVCVSSLVSCAYWCWTHESAVQHGLQGACRMCP